MNRFTYFPDVVTLELDTEKCVGCGMCATVCPHAVFRMENGRASAAMRDRCMECGACATNCPTGAVSVAAGVGCAAALINAALGRSDADCCCIAEPRESSSGSPNGKKSKGIGCC